MTATSLEVRTQSPKIDARGLNFCYGKFYVPKNVSLQIPKEQATAFISPSDYGESTLLRTSNKMYALYPEQRAEGQINMDGENLLTPYMGIALLRVRADMVFQKPTPLPMSIYDNTAFDVKLSERPSRSEMNDRVEQVLAKTALWSEVKDKFNQSDYGPSGGQQQHLCTARGIAVRPEVLLLDEPCSALDPISTGKIEELIAELEDDYTVVIVMHNMQQAARCSDYTAYIYSGGLIEFGDTEKIFIRPQRKEMEDYITSRFGWPATTLKLKRQGETDV